MNDFKVGDTVRIRGSVQRGAIGAVMRRDEEGRGFFVRLSTETQEYFLADELERLEAPSM